MNKERKMSELLQIVLDRLKTNSLKAGLCGIVLDTLVNDDTSDKESTRLLTYIRENRPSKYSSFSAFTNRHSNFYWKVGEKAPRIKWLEKEIKFLKIIKE